MYFDVYFSVLMTECFSSIFVLIHKVKDVEQEQRRHTKLTPQNRVVFGNLWLLNCSIRSMLTLKQEAVCSREPSNSETLC
jgi:hypothetical protein